MRTTRALALAAAAAGLFTVSAASAQETYSFALWGDMPYAKADDAPAIPALLEDMNAADLAFSLYDGDIKDGSSQCTDDVYESALSMFNTLTAPAIYVPGDNEWTDCHRTNNGGYDNLERLAHVRKVMFPSATGTLGKTQMKVARQDGYIENVRFSKGGAMFVGLNVPGSNNNKVSDDESCTKKSARTLDQCAADNAEYEARDKANIAWMTAAFDAAKAAGDKGVMIVIQGDPGFDVPETEEVDESRLPGKEGYAAFLDALIAQTEAYDGQVVLVHGDTHFFKIDKPLPDAFHMLANFTRVQTFGSPNIQWIKVGVDAASRDVFTFRPMVVAANAKKSLSK